MMSSTKPKVQNILQCCHRRTEPRPLVKKQKISWGLDMMF